MLQLQCMKSLLSFFNDEETAKIGQMCDQHLGEKELTYLKHIKEMRKETPFIQRTSLGHFYVADSHNNMLITIEYRGRNNVNPFVIDYSYIHLDVSEDERSKYSFCNIDLLTSHLHKILKSKLSNEEIELIVRYLQLVVKHYDIRKLRFYEQIPYTKY